MEKKTWDILHNLVFSAASTLQNGKHATADEWRDIADDLKRAGALADEEANRLALKELIVDEKKKIRR